MEATEQPKNEALLSLRDRGPDSLVERVDEFIVSMATVVKRTESLVPTAQEFTITNEAGLQFADEMRVELETEAKGLDNERLQLTRPLDDLKTLIMDQVKPAITNNKAAAQIYNLKALAFRAEQRRIADEARREAERIQRETQARLEAEARKKEEAASKLKTEKARQAKMEEADALRQAAIHTPVSMAVSGPAPVSTASNVVEKWDATITNPSEFLRWLADHPEWQSVVTFTASGMGRIARQYKDTLPVPGVSITSSEAFRKKATR